MIEVKFEIWCIDSTPNHDWISEQLKQNADHWINIKHLNGLQAARQISDEQLDILIELGGFTSSSRLDCLVHRPCPIQLSYLGYPAPTHLNCIDGWIGDQELFSTLDADERKAHQLFSSMVDTWHLIQELEYRNQIEIIRQLFALVASIMHAN